MTAHLRLSPEALAAELAAATFRKASYSGGGGNACVELGPRPNVVFVRDSKDPHGPTLAFTPEAVTNFLRDLRAGSFDG